MLANCIPIYKKAYLLQQINTFCQTREGRDKTAMEMLDSIRDTENKAKEIRQKAQTDARNIIAAAAEKSAKEAEEIEKNAAVQADSILEETKKEISALTEEQNRTFFDKSAKLRASAENNISKAADYILKELFAL